MKKQDKIKYLGFDDTWFMIIGIILLSFVTDFLINNSFGRGLPVIEAVISWAVALFFATVDWLIMRKILIFLRKKYPSFQDDVRRIVYFIIGIILTVVIVDFLGTLFFKYVIGLNYHMIEKLRLLIPVIIVSMMTMAIYEAIYFYTRLKISIRQEEQSKQVIVEAQLDALKNQAQPHFFFNTLNTLKDIIDQNTKEEAKDFVDKLSDIYRFILDKRDTNLITLDDEINFSKAYAHVQKERFGDNLHIHWNISPDILSKAVIPMSIQLLLENAIKHNVVSRSKPLTIEIKNVGNKIIVSNPLQPKTTQLPSTKLGLENISRRYALISETPVEIINDNTFFEVRLPLIDPNQNA